MMEKSVVLPAPFGPISAVMRPSGAASEARVDRQQTAEAVRDAFHDQERAQPWPASAVTAVAARGATGACAARQAADQPRGKSQMTSTSTTP